MYGSAASSGYSESIYNENNEYGSRKGQRNQQVE